MSSQIENSDNNCFVCNRIKQIQDGVNPYFVAETLTGYVVLCDFQLYKGYTIFLSKIHAQELHQLDGVMCLKFLEEMSLVGEAVYKTFRPVKLNYELLGNTDPHLHWHLIPRYKDDPKPGTAIWAVDESIRSADANRPTLSELQELKNRLAVNLDI